MAMESLSLHELVKELPGRLHDADAQVDVAAAVLRHLLQVGAYSVHDAKAALRTLKAACHERDPQLARLAMEVLSTLLSCSQPQLVMALLEYLPCVVPSGASSSSSSSFSSEGGRLSARSLMTPVAAAAAAAASSSASSSSLPAVSSRPSPPPTRTRASAEYMREMQRVLECLEAVMATDRSFLVPVIRTVYELDCLHSEELSARIFDVSLDALNIVDSSDIPAVIRTLLKSALGLGSRHNDHSSSSSSSSSTTAGNLDRVVQAVRRCGSSLPVSEQGPLLEAISDVVAVSSPIAFAFLRSFQASAKAAPLDARRSWLLHVVDGGQLFNMPPDADHHPRGDRNQGRTSTWIPMSPLDMFVLISVCTAGARVRDTSRLSSSSSSMSRHQVAVQRAVVSIVTSPSFDARGVFLAAAERLTLGPPWESLSADFVCIMIFLQRWGCSVLAAPKSMVGVKGRLVRHGSTFHATEQATRILHAVAEVQIRLLSTPGTSHGAEGIRDTLFASLLAGCLPHTTTTTTTGIGAEAAALHSRGDARTHLMRADTTLEAERGCRLFLCGSTGGAHVHHVALVCSDVLLQLVERHPEVVAGFSLRVEDVVNRLLAHDACTSAGSNIAQGSGVASPILHRLMRLSVVIGAADENGTRRQSQLIYVRKRLSTFSTLNQNPVRGALFMASHLIFHEKAKQSLDAPPPPPPPADAAHGSSGHSQSATPMAGTIGEWIFRVAKLLTTPDLQLAAFNALADCACYLPRSLLPRVLRTCVWPICVQQRLFSHVVGTSNDDDDDNGLETDVNDPGATFASPTAARRPRRRASRSGRQRCADSLRPTTHLESFLNDLTSGARRHVVRVMPLLSRLNNQNRFSSGTGRASGSSSSSSSSSDCDSPAASAQSLALAIALWRLLLTFLKLSDETTPSQTPSTSRNHSRGVPTMLAACSRIEVKLPDWLDVNDLEHSASLALTTRTPNELRTCIWILLHGIGIGIVSVLALVDLLHQQKRRRCGRKNEDAGSPPTTPVDDLDNRNFQSLSLLVLVALRRVVVCQETTTRLLQIYVQRKATRSYKPRKGGHHAESSSDHARKENRRSPQKTAQIQGMFSTLQTLWNWLRYEIRHRPGFLPFLLDVYDAEVGNAKPSVRDASPHSTQHVPGAKSAVVTSLCLAFGVLEVREGLESVQRRFLSSKLTEMYSAWPLTASLEDSLRHVQLHHHATVNTDLPAFVDQPFLKLLARSSFWRGALRDFQAQRSGTTTTTTTSAVDAQNTGGGRATGSAATCVVVENTHRVHLAVLLHQLYKCMDVFSTTAGDICPELFSEATFHLFLARFATEDDANLAILLLDILNWICEANWAQRLQRGSSSVAAAAAASKKNESNLPSDTANLVTAKVAAAEQMDVDVLRVTFAVAVLGVVPAHSVVGRRFASNARSLRPRSAEATLVTASLSSTLPALDDSGRSEASLRAKPLASLLRATGAATGSKRHGRAIRGGGPTTFTHHALASIHAKLVPERFVEFSALFFHEAFTFLGWWHVVVSTKGSNSAAGKASAGDGVAQRRRTAAAAAAAAAASSSSSRKQQADVHPTLRLLTIGTAADHLGHLLDLHLATLAAASFPVATLEPTQTLLTLFERKRGLGAGGGFADDGYVDSSPYAWLHRWVSVYLNFVSTTLNVVVGASAAGPKKSRKRSVARRRKRKPGSTQDTGTDGKAKRQTRGHRRSLSSSPSDSESQDLAENSSDSEGSGFSKSSSKNLSAKEAGTGHLSDDDGGSGSDRSNAESDGHESGSFNNIVDSEDEDGDGDHDEQDHDADGSNDDDDDDDDDGDGVVGDDLIPADKPKRSNERARSRLQAPRRQAPTRRSGGGPPGAASVAVHCLQHVVRTMGAVLPALRVRIEDCIVWRATCRRNPQARGESLSGRDLTPRVVVVQAAAHAASTNGMLDIERLADLLAQCDRLRACLHGLCHQVKARVRVNVTVSVMKKIPLAIAAVEAFAATLRAMAQENHLDVPWSSVSTYEVPMGPGGGVKQKPAAAQPNAVTVGAWLARLFELPAHDVSVDSRWNQKLDQVNSAWQGRGSNDDGSDSESEEEEEEEEEDSSSGSSSSSLESD